MKINTNESIQNNLAVEGGITRDNQGGFLGTLSNYLGHRTMLHVVLISIMISLEFVETRG